jgi:ribosomal protein S27AE
MQRLIDANALKLTGDICEIVEEIMDAPTVEPKRGEWVGQHKATCSECGAISSLAYIGIHKNFCSSCGADMRKEATDGR